MFEKQIKKKQENEILDCICRNMTILKMYWWNITEKEYGIKILIKMN